jgi:hypothetical protein
VVEVLDANHDGIIDSDEINNAPQELKKLDKKGTGQLTIPELLGPPPRGMMGPGGDQNGPPGEDDQNQPPPPPPDQSGTDGRQGPPPQ